jgi:TonB family protein
MNAAIRAGLGRRGAILAAGATLAGALGLAAAWIASVREDPPRRTTLRYRVATVHPTRTAKPAPEPRPEPAGRESPAERVVHQATATSRVEIKASDLLDPSAPPPPVAGGAAGRAAPGGGGGRLGLAEVGEGPGDAFGLVGKPSGRSLLGKGKLGDGSGPEDEGGEDDDRPGDARARDAAALQRYAWYYGRLAAELADAFRGVNALQSASATVELRVWVDGRGRVSRVKLARSTGDRALDEAIRSVQGLTLRQPPPSDVPMPMIARLVVRRPE